MIDENVIRSDRSVLICSLALTLFMVVCRSQATEISAWTNPVVFGGVTNGTINRGFQPQIATDYHNNWVCVFNGYPDGKNAGIADTEVMYSASTDGVNWTEPEPLNIDWPADGIGESVPAIAASPDGNWMCVWQRGEGEILMSRSLGGPHDWSWPTRIHLSRPVNPMHPGVGYVGNDSWLIAWYNDRNIWSARVTENGDNQSTPTIVLRSIHIGGDPTVPPYSFSALDPVVTSAPYSDVVFVGFSAREQIEEGAATTTSWYGTGKSSRDGGISFPDDFGKLRPTLNGTDRMAGDSHGRWLAASKKFEQVFAPRSLDKFGPNVSFLQSSNGGQSFTEFSVEPESGGKEDWGHVAMDFYGHWKVFWATTDEADNPPQKLYYSESGDAGKSWSAKKLFNYRNSSGIGVPQIFDVAATGAGGFVAVWSALLPSGDSVILHSSNMQDYSSAANWSLYE